MKRKYLDDIGLKDRWDSWTGNEKSQEKYAKERETYGFDSRETFSLDETFYQWLYERLMMFMAKADKVVDMESEQTPRWEWEGKEYNQKQLIEMCLNNLREYLRFQADMTDVVREYQCNKTDGTWMDYSEIEDMICKKAQDAAKIFVMILPAMWW